MVPIQWLTLVWLTVLVPLAGCTRTPFREEIAFRETADVQGIEGVYVETKNGAIDVQCLRDADRVDIQGVKFASGVTPEDARARAEEVLIDVQRDNARPGILRIVAKCPVVNNGNRGASFRLILPQAVATELLTSNGEVSVTGATRGVRVETTNGRIHVNDIQADVYARTSNGTVRARDVRGDVDVHSSNGEIDMERVDAARINAETSNGRVRVVQATGDATLRTSNGSIELRLVFVPDRPTVKAVTSNGNVTMELPDAISAKLTMRTSNGRVDAKFKDGAVKDLQSSRHNLTATLNSGAGSVDIESTNGSATLCYAPAATGR